MQEPSSQSTEYRVLGEHFAGSDPEVLDALDNAIGDLTISDATVMLAYHLIEGWDKGHDVLIDPPTWWDEVETWVRDGHEVLRRKGSA